MNAVLSKIAEAVAALINGGTYSQTLTAAVKFLPLIQLPETESGFVVQVAPRVRRIRIAARSYEYHDYTVDVGVMRRVSDDAEVDACLVLCEELIDRLRFTRLVDPPAAFKAVRNRPAYLASHLERFRQFSSVIAVSYRLQVKVSKI